MGNSPSANWRTRRWGSVAVSLTSRTAPSASSLSLSALTRAGDTGPSFFVARPSCTARWSHSAPPSTAAATSRPKLRNEALATLAEMAGKDELKTRSRPLKSDLVLLVSWCFRHVGNR